MNERIKELAETAYRDVVCNHTIGDTVSREAVDQHFAELIVRECKTALYKQYSNGEFMYLEGCYKTISDHFGISGVEE